MVNLTNKPNLLSFSQSNSTNSEEKPLVIDGDRGPEYADYDYRDYDTYDQYNSQEEDNQREDIQKGDNDTMTSLAVS